MSLPPVPKNWHWAKGTPAGGLHAWLGQLRGSITDLESRSGTSVTPADDDGAVALDTTDGVHAKVAAVTTGKNLYDPAEKLTGHYINWVTGALDANASYVTTGYIRVTPGQPYTLSGARSAAFFDASGTYLPGTALNNVAETPHTLTAPAGAASLRASWAPARHANFQVEKGTQATAYEPYEIGLAPALTEGLLTDAKAYTDQAIAALGPTGPGAAPSGLEPLRMLKDFAAGQVNLGVVSDSTANDINEWVRIWAQKWGQTLPAAVRRTYRSWDATASAWRTVTVDNAGTSPSQGVIVDDDFSTVGEVVGSTPDAGPVWTGSTAPGWASDGTLATLSSEPSVISTNLGAKDQTVRATLSLITTAQSAQQVLRVYAASGTAGLYTGVWAALTINTGGGAAVALYKTIGGTTTTLSAAVPVAGLSINSATPQAVTVEITTAIQQVRVDVTVGGQTTTRTGTLDEADVASLGNYAGIAGIPNASFAYAYRLDAFHAHTPAYDNPVQSATLAVHNAAVAGWSFHHYDEATRAMMFGTTDIDVLVVAFGHNNGSQTAAAFTSEAAAWIDGWLTEHPESAIVVVSQNPQAPPSAGIVAHRDRQAGLRTWAKNRGYDYVGVFEAFLAQPDGGASLIQTDGVHPTSPAPGTLTGDFGSVLWADTFTAAI